MLMLIIYKTQFKFKTTENNHIYFAPNKDTI